MDFVNLMWDFCQSHSIQSHAAELRQLRRETAAALSSGQEHQAALWNHIAFLEQENDALKLGVAALMRLLVAKQIVGAEELRATLQEVDAEDGRTDGRYHLPLLPPVEGSWREPPPAASQDATSGDSPSR